MPRTYSAQSKEASAHSKRVEHIESVLARRKAEAQAAATDEARKQQAWEDRKRLQQRGAPEAPAPSRSVAEASAKHEGGRLSDSSSHDRAKGSAELRWERMMNGGSRKKTSKVKERDVVSKTADERSNLKKFGEDSLSVRSFAIEHGRGSLARVPHPNGANRHSETEIRCARLQVEETNRMRASLGMAPLRV